MQDGHRQGWERAAPHECPGFYGLIARNALVQPPNGLLYPKWKMAVPKRQKGEMFVFANDLVLK